MFPRLTTRGPMRRRHLFPFIAAASYLGATLIVGCAQSVQRAPAPAAPDAPAAAAPGVAVENDGREGATLSVDNSSIFDVRMFVVRGSHYVRLGLVISGATKEFPIP